MATTPRIVSPEWLLRNLHSLRVIDGSWYLPSMQRNARAEFLARHIPGARFLDIDAVAKKNTPLPHMLPRRTTFASFMSKNGIGNDDEVVVYDGVGFLSSCRVEWMLRVFGHDRVSILDGGLPEWIKHGGLLESGEPGPIEPKPYKAIRRRELEARYPLILQATKDASYQIVDARPNRRFLGLDPEPRPVPSGHMPNSLSVPVGSLLTPDMAHMKPVEEIKNVFTAAGVTKDKPIIFTCGSGVNACTLEFAARAAGYENVRVYDGSWIEYASQHGAVIKRDPSAPGRDATDSDSDDE